MNAGLGNLDSVKRHLLAVSLVGQTNYDQVLLDLALGSAGMIENFCNRKFARAVGDQAIFQGDRVSFCLPRFPIETVTAVDTKATDADGWISQTLSTFIQSTTLQSGMVYVPEHPDVGPFYSQVRFTYTGGYWFETLEPQDVGYPSAMPGGATALPSELRLAWLMTCRALWQAVDKVGTSILESGAAGPSIGQLPSMDLPPLVKKMLWNYSVMQVV